MISIGKMLEQLSGLIDTKDISDWENSFLNSVYGKYISQKKNTQFLTERQIDTIESIWKKHFA